MSILEFPHPVKAQKCSLTLSFSFCVLALLEQLIADWNDLKTQIVHPACAFAFWTMFLLFGR